MKSRTSRTLFAGVGVLAIAIGVFGISLTGALGSPLPPMSATDIGPDPSTNAVDEDVGTLARTGLSAEVIAMASERAPFESDRRPSRAYRMPEERIEVAVRPVPDLPDPPEFELLGSVSGPDGGFVVMRVDGGDPQLLRAGDSVDGYEVSAVEPNYAVIAGPARSWQVPLASESPTVDRTDEDEDDDRRRRRRNDDDDKAGELRIPAEVMERVGNVMRQMPAFQGGPIQFGEDGSISITAPGQGNGSVIVRQNVRSDR